MDSPKPGEAVEAFRRYVQSFQSLDPRAVGTHFHEPALSITPQGVTDLPTRAAVEESYQRVMADLPARGYARTELSAVTEHRLGADVAIVTAIAAWKTSSGNELTRFGMTHTLRRGGEGWRIVVATIHDPA